MFQYLIDLLETLHLLHKEDIIHRDIKPANIVQVSDDGDKNVREYPEKTPLLYLVDFGSSKQLEPGIDNKFTRNYPRTPLYAPPETLNEVDLEDEKLDFDKYNWLVGYFNSNSLLEKHRWTRDLYSLGVTICELLNGIPQRIYSRFKPSDKIWSEWMLDLRFQVPNLYPILERMSRFYPNERYQTAMDALLDTSTQAWLIYGDGKDNRWLFNEKLLEDALKDIEKKEINSVPQLQRKFLKASDDEVKRKKIERYRSYNN
ncbi:MAG: hypothetical protein SWY16_13770 [Cyanobacteriota bacterium]|nr:hypothetical protein [Cyanobacteriota bacterium]